MAVPADSKQVDADLRVCARLTKIDAPAFGAAAKMNEDAAFIRLKKLVARQLLVPIGTRRVRDPVRGSHRRVSEFALTDAGKRRVGGE